MTGVIASVLILGVLAAWLLWLAVEIRRADAVKRTTDNSLVLGAERECPIPGCHLAPGHHGYRSHP